MGRNPKKKSSKKKSGGGGGSKHDSDDEWEEGITTITGEESGDEMMDEDGGDPDRCAPPSNPVHVLDPNPAVASRTLRGCSSRRPHRSISRRRRVSRPLSPESHPRRRRPRMRVDDSIIIICQSPDSTEFEEEYLWCPSTERSPPPPRSPLARVFSLR